MVTPQRKSGINPRPMKIAIVGSRSFSDCAVLESWILSHIAAESISLVISGGASGADTLAEQFAKKFNIPTMIFLPDWKKYGRRAGIIRNVDIIKNCDICFAFWDGQSRGTKNDIELCQRYSKTVYIYRF